jgi:SpoVK/Ycf46/Vps4 family AAA+-type ATPase
MSKSIFKAAAKGDIADFLEILNNGADINGADKSGQTPLIIATIHNHTPLAQFIINYGADTDTTDYYGKTALYYAEMEGNSPLTALLESKLSRDSDNERPDDKTPDAGLYVAVTENVYNILQDIKPLLESLEFGHRPYVLEDMTKAMLLGIRGSELTTLCKYAFSILAYGTVNDDLDNKLTELNDLPQDEVIKTMLKLYESQTAFFKKLDSYEYNFTFNSFVLFEEQELTLLKSALYQFAEVMVKADGTVTPQEVENLKQLNIKYLSREAQDINKGEQVQDTAPATTPVASIETLTAELNELVGLDNIKADIQSLINIIKSNKARAAQGLPQLKSALHAVFMGPPGTGKTTIARLLANLYSSLGVLEGNNFVETDRSGLVAGYVGQTAMKTDGVVKNALNGVLFIDEAYTLARGGDGADYGQEAIDTLLKRMEDHRDELVVIVAGYEAEMNNFIASNPGLQSRFSRNFYFKDYNPDELYEILVRMATKAGFSLTPPAALRYKDMFTRLYNARGNQFGNARLVRNIFEKTFEKHANRTAPIAPITREILTTIEAADIPYDEFLGSLNNTQNR